MIDDEMAGCKVNEWRRIDMIKKSVNRDLEKIVKVKQA